MLNIKLKLTNLEIDTKNKSSHKYVSSALTSVGACCKQKLQPNNIICNSNEKVNGKCKKMKKNEKNLDYDEICGYDEHCCSAHDDGQGYCEICGAVIPGSYAYYETYGGEYPERSSDYRDI